MQSHPEAQNATVFAAQDTPQGMRRAERAYQGLTIAAMLALLWTLWLFH